MKVDKKEIKEKIEDYEFYNSGISHINGAYVDVVNIKIKQREQKVYADVKLVKQMDGTTERHNDCEYSFKLLGVRKMKQKIEGLKCPNCSEELDLEYQNKDMGQFGICDVYGCEDCTHIQVLDWKADTEEDLKLNYNEKKYSKGLEK